jgi:hypothetical protein
MTRAEKIMCQAATLLLLFSFTSAPAKAQLAGFGGEDTMTQMAPMLNMMKAKMGKRRFASMMQTMGPMMEGMMDGGGFGGMSGGGFGGGAGFGGFGGGNIMGMMGGSGNGQMMAMIPQLMQMGNFGGGHGRRHHRRH